MRKLFLALVALAILGAACHRKCPAYAHGNDAEPVVASVV
jgi:predicted small lipoprotein YifL